MKKSHLILCSLGLLSIGIATRLLPHPPNLTSIGAITLIGSLYLGKRWGLILPLTAVFISDLVLGFYNWKIMLSVYVSFGIIGLMSWISTKHRSPIGVSTATIGSSIIFFIVTNTAVWLYTPWYEKSLSGLLYCYELGLPFFRNMLLGDLLYTVLLILAIEGVLMLQKLARQLPWAAPARNLKLNFFKP